MPRKEHNELAAGVFVVLCLTVALGVVLWLGSDKLFNQARQKAYFYTQIAAGSSGLREGLSVQVGGKEIGRISQVNLMPQKGMTLFVVDVNREDLRFYSNGKSHVVPPLVGDSLLSVTDTGDPNRAPEDPNVPVAANDENHPILVTGGFDEAVSSITKAANDVRDIADNLLRQMDANKPDTMLAHFNSLATKIDSAAGSIDRAASDVSLQLSSKDPNSFLGKLLSSADHIESFTSQLDRMAADADPKVKGALTALATTADQLRDYFKKDIAEILAKIKVAGDEAVKTTKDFSAISQQVRDMVTYNKPGVDEMLDNFVLTSANLKATSAEVRRNPWRLLYKPSEDEQVKANIFDAARAFSSGAAELDQAVTKLRMVEPNSIDPAELKEISAHLQATFEKFTKAEQGLWRQLQVESSATAAPRPSPTPAPAKK